MKTTVILRFLCALIFLTACAPTARPTETATPAPAVPVVSADCAFQTAETPLAPPADLYGKQPLTGSEIQVEDFTFVFWLYCDPALQPQNQGAAYSAIPALGLFAQWRYDGPQKEGHYADFWGLEPDVKSANAWDGPLYRAGSGVTSGIQAAPSALQAYLQQGTPFRYHVGLETPEGKKEVIFSFTLTKNGDAYNLSAVSPEVAMP